MRTLRGLPKSYLVRRHLGGLGVSLSVGKHIKWGRPATWTTLHNWCKHILCKHKHTCTILTQVTCTSIYASTSSTTWATLPNLCKHTQGAQPYAVQGQAHIVQAQAHIVQTTCPESCATQCFYLLLPVVVCSTSDSSSNGGGSGEIKSNLLQKMQSRCCHPTTGPPSSRCNTNTSSFTAATSLKI